MVSTYGLPRPVRARAVDTMLLRDPLSPMYPSTYGRHGRTDFLIGMRLNARASGGSIRWLCATSPCDAAGRGVYHGSQDNYISLLRQTTAVRNHHPLSWPPTRHSRLYPRLPSFCACPLHCSQPKGY